MNKSRKLEIAITDAVNVLKNQAIILEQILVDPDICEYIAAGLFAENESMEPNTERLLGYLRPYIKPDDEGEAFDLIEFAAVLSERVCDDLEGAEQWEKHKHKQQHAWIIKPIIHDGVDFTWDTKKGWVVGNTYTIFTNAEKETTVLPDNGCWHLS